MSTPVTTAHRNLFHRVRKLLETAKDPTPWQLDMVHRALADLEFGRYPDGEHTMSKAERPDLYQPATYRGDGGRTVKALRLRLGELTAPKE